MTSPSVDLTLTVGNHHGGVMEEVNARSRSRDAAILGLAVLAWAGLSAGLVQAFGVLYGVLGSVWGGSLLGLSTVVVVDQWACVRSSVAARLPAPARSAPAPAPQPARAA